MEPRKIFMWLFLHVLLVSMMSTGCQAQELIEVNASDILEQIENGEDIYLENVRITGELNLNDIKLKTIPIEWSNFHEVGFDLNDELKVVKSKITIVYSVFESDVDFSNTQFNEALDFYNTSFKGETDLGGSSFIQSTNFQKANFNRNNFISTNFYEDTNFQLVKFNNGADFRWAEFNAYANFEDASFNGDANIGRLYENVVLVELKRRDKDVYYWKNKYECDFLTTQGKEVKEAIQVCYELTDENKDREINGLIETMDEFKLKDGLIITGDLEGEEIRGGKNIVYKPLWKWLLE